MDFVSRASLCAFTMFNSVQLVMWSIHLLGGLLFYAFYSVPYKTVSMSRLSGMQHICPWNSCDSLLLFTGMSIWYGLTSHSTHFRAFIYAQDWSFTFQTALYFTERQAVWCLQTVAFCAVKSGINAANALSGGMIAYLPLTMCRQSVYLSASSPAINAIIEQCAEPALPVIAISSHDVLR